MGWTKVGLYHSKGKKLPWVVRWYGEIDPKTGKQRRYSKSFRIKREAEDFKSEQMQEFKGGIKRDLPEEIQLGRLCHDFLATWNPDAAEVTIDLYKKTVERLKGYFGKDSLINSIDSRRADGFLACQTHWMNDSERKLSQWSRQQIIRHCKTIFEVSLRWNWIKSNPFKDAKVPKPGTKRWHRMTVDEYSRLLNAAPNIRWKVFYALAYTSGGRFGELFNLTWADIDFERGRMIIENREGNDKMPPFRVKDKEARWVQLPSQTIDLLTKYQQEAPEGVPYILLTPARYERVLQRWHKYRKQGKEWQNRFMVNNVGRDFQRHAKIADIKFDGHFSIHTFRKSCAQNWADYLPANVVKFFLGHSTLSTTNRFYSIVDESHATLTKTTMDALLETVTPNDLDAEQTLAPESAPKEDKKILNTPSENPVNPSPEDTCEMGNNGRYRTRTCDSLRVKQVL